MRVREAASPSASPGAPIQHNRQFLYSPAYPSFWTACSDYNTFINTTSISPTVGIRLDRLGRQQHHKFKHHIHCQLQRCILQRHISLQWSVQQQHHKFNRHCQRRPAVYLSQNNNGIIANSTFISNNSYGAFIDSSYGNTFANNTFIAGNGSSLVWQQRLQHILLEQLHGHTGLLHA